jgi:hypothetical protein
MKKLFLLPMLCLLFLGMSSFSSSQILVEDNEPYRVTLTFTDAETGETSQVSYISYSRTSAADCDAGGQALANGNFMQSIDFTVVSTIFDL